MTILSSKKPTNNNKDSSSTQQQQQQQQQTSQQSQTRTHLSRDDEHPNSPININNDANESTDTLPSSSAITTNDLHSMITTSSPIYSMNSKRKSHGHHRLHQTINKQARRRCTSMEENSSSNDENLASSSSSTIPRNNNNQNFDENDQYNSEDEYDQRTLKYDRNNLNEVCYSISFFIYFVFFFFYLA
jgi:hypothetical protein